VKNGIPVLKGAPQIKFGNKGIFINKNCMVQPKYSPEEALQRIKLMMEYDSSKTLTENKKVISEQITPAELGTTAAGAVTGGAIAAGGLGALGGSIAATGVLGSAAAGAAAGSAAFPVVGTAVGALVGLGLGALINWRVNKDKGKEGFVLLMEACKSSGASKLVKKMSSSEIRSIAFTIEDAKGDWNDDEDAIVSALQKIETIADLCAVDKKVPGGLVEFLDSVTDSPKEWRMFTRPIEGMIEDTEIVLTPEEQKKTDDGKKTDNGKKTGSGYKPCSGTYSFGCKSDVIAKVQGCLGLVTDGKFGPKTKAALSEKGITTFTDADVNKICEKQDVEQKLTSDVEIQSLGGEQSGSSTSQSPDQESNTKTGIS
jgi:hypothetical protein